MSDVSAILKNIVQEYPAPDGGTTRIVDNISLEYKTPSINFLLGPSGCGKSTILRMMGGYRPENVKTPTSGDVYINGKPCFDVHEDVIMVFQSPALYPFRTVRQNIEYPFTLGLWAYRIPETEMKDRVDWILDRVGLLDKQNNRPSQLSGGQQQRVALACALVLKPQILLMDEPFKGLDAHTLHEAQKLLVSLWQEVKSLVVFVSHDIDEALRLGDRITVLSTKPATIAKDYTVDTPRNLRGEEWLRTPKVEHMKLEIMELLRG